MSTMPAEQPPKLGAATPQDIDFLPPAYRRGKQRRRKVAWQRVLLAVCLLLIGMGCLHERQRRSQRDIQRRHVQEQVSLALASLDDPAVVRKRIARLDAKADLLATLHVHAAPTRLLATVTETLPRFVSLNGYRMATETRRRPEGRRPGEKKPPAAAPPKKDAKQDEPAIPEQSDLQELRKQRATTNLVITLEGVAPDDLTISKYLAALGTTRLFTDVQLLFTDRRVHRGHELRSFGIRLEVRNPELGTSKSTSPNGKRD